MTAEIELLEGAIALLKKGWCQGVVARNAAGNATSTWSDAKQHCAIGAMMHVVALSPLLSCACRQARRRLYSMVPDAITAFNDAEGRTAEEVIKLFEKALESAKNGEEVPNADAQ